MKRYGMAIRLRPEAEASYKTHHRAVWPEVLERIAACNIHNYSIFLHAGTLFAYFEYVGQDYKADMQKMAADPKTQEWWAIMDPMQEPLATHGEGEWWTALEEVFHTD
ncbi:L-rhamnose mutarotase [Granulicella arctica]|uniref:L-rhamnose mutarotase n=1 Tax=Granulicella arctica TaxID=940613 RepID=UPI0021DF8192|nr:L-rhamnose mutarotase [Granulicella arctica]